MSPSFLRIGVEIKAPIEQLSKILDNMIMLDGTVTRAKMTIKFEAMEE